MWEGRKTGRGFKNLEQRGAEMKKLAECLLRRKELQEKVTQCNKFKGEDLYEVKAKRVKVTEDVEDFVASVPKLKLKQVTAEYDFYARQLRHLDGAIQKMNWIVDVDGADETFRDYEEA